MLRLPDPTATGASTENTGKENTFWTPYTKKQQQLRHNYVNADVNLPALMKREAERWRNPIVCARYDIFNH